MQQATYTVLNSASERSFLSPVRVFPSRSQLGCSQKDDNEQCVCSRSFLAKALVYIAFYFPEQYSSSALTYRVAETLWEEEVGLMGMVGRAGMVGKEKRREEQRERGEKQ